MNKETDIEWIEPYEGFVYNEQTVVVESTEQTRALKVCGIDPAIFGGKADPSAFIGIAIRAGVASGISSDGSVNMVQSLIQHCPVNLDEELRVSGRVLTVEAVPRGTVVGSEVRFVGADGEIAITARRQSLRPDPDKAGVRGAGDRPPLVVEDVARLRKLAEVKMSPERVTDYQSTGNRIHFDPEAARRAGFRAPIIGGGMGVHYLIAEIWRQFSPRTLDLDIYFRRPIFWDDEILVLVDDDGESGDNTWQAICLAKGEKVATEARINHIG